MSKLNSESKSEKNNEIDLEASNQFTLKGDDDTQYDAMLIESNKKSSLRSCSHRSIKILNLSDFSFCGTDHKIKLEEIDFNGNNNEEKENIINSPNHISIIPRDRNSNTLFIKFTKLSNSSSKRLNKSSISIKEIKESIKEINIQSEDAGHNSKVSKDSEKELIITSNNISEKENDNSIESIHSANEINKKMEIDLNSIVSESNKDNEIKENSDNDKDKDKDIFSSNQESNNIELNSIISDENKNFSNVNDKDKDIIPFNQDSNNNEIISITSDENKNISNDNDKDNTHMDVELIINEKNNNIIQNN